MRVVGEEKPIDASSFCSGGDQDRFRVRGSRWIVAFAVRRLEVPVPLRAAYVLGEATQHRIQAAETPI